MSNWFNAAGSTATPPSLLAQSAAYQPNPNPNTPQRNPQSNLFASSPGYYSNQHVRDTIPAADLNESQNLQNRYLESFTPGNKKKSSAAKTASSPTGSSSFTEPSRFGSNSLYGSGAGVSPSKTAHRLSRPPLNQSTSSLSTSVRSRMSTGGSISTSEIPFHLRNQEREGRMDEDRPPVLTYAEIEAGGGKPGRGYGMGAEMEGSDDGMFDDDDTPTNLLMIYGLPASKQDKLQSLLSSYGPLNHFQPGPLESNYVIVSFTDPSVGLRLKRQSGALRLDGWYFGVRDAGDDISLEHGARNGIASGAGVDGLPSGASSHTALQTTTRPNEGSNSTPSSSANGGNGDIFSSLRTLTPVRAEQGSVFLPQTIQSSVSQPVMPAAYSFGTGAEVQGQGAKGQRVGLFGRISDVMFGQ